VSVGNKHHEYLVEAYVTTFEEAVESAAEIYAKFLALIKETAA
jgi:hypothetical protein